MNHELRTPDECTCSDGLSAKELDNKPPCVVCDFGLAVCKHCGKAEEDLEGPCLNHPDKQWIKAHALELHKRWLDKAETATIRGSERTVLPYGYLQTACSQAMRDAFIKARNLAGEEKKNLDLYTGTDPQTRLVIENCKEHLYRVILALDHIIESTIE